MNEILQSWTILTHLVMGSLLGPMTLMRDLPLILTLMSLVMRLSGVGLLSYTHKNLMSYYNNVTTV